MVRFYRITMVVVVCVLFVSFLVIGTEKHTPQETAAKASEVTHQRAAHVEETAKKETPTDETWAYQAGYLGVVLALCIISTSMCQIP